MIIDELLQPIVDALARTELGAPKTQAVIDRHIEALEAMLGLGLTYKQIAAGLNDRGARGRTGAEFTEQSLYNLISRARGRKDRPPVAATRRPSVRPADFGRPSPPSGAQNSPISPELDRFRQRIDQARTQAAMDEFLFRRGKSR
ncbi:recombinase family protein [Bradyrhizobium sp. C-145]|uniref:recombinase family protein n=1 Tax=Bradyrhizobium sp. C-145 TaxID=574727 RepID=UPI00201B767F|nr:recombinase family protein [Bradyrhizobium sp. C-145]UQR60784.1 recombinase family protein [Bradyrhizobium sp. C-145]